MGVRGNSIFSNISILKARFNFKNKVNDSFWQLNEYFLRSITSGFEAMAINIWWVNEYINFPKQLQNSVFKIIIFNTARNAWYLQTFPPPVLFFFVTFTFQSFYILCQIICSVFTNLQFRFQNVKFWFYFANIILQWL